MQLLFPVVAAVGAAAASADWSALGGPSLCCSASPSPSAVTLHGCTGGH
jgi:hypothetical protein